MAVVKIIQVLEHYSDEFAANSTDIAQITDWETVPDTDMHILRDWLRQHNSNRYGGYKEGTLYALLIIPEVPISPVKSVAEVIENYKKENDKQELIRRKARERSEATKQERKRKTFERLKKELEGGN